MKYLKKLFLALVFTFAMPLAVLASAAPSGPAANASAGCTITSMEVEAVLTSSNTLTVVEEIAVHFDETSPGFTRVLPVGYTLAREIDGVKQSKTYSAEVSNITVNGNPVSGTATNGQLSIPVSIWAAGTAGNATYSLAYTYQMEGDGIPEFDDIFYSFTGGTLPAATNLQFTFTFPKTTSFSTLAIFTGSYGDLQPSAAANSVKYQQNGLTVTATVASLAAGRSVTLYTRLPAGYFSGAGAMPYTPLYIAAGVLAAAFLLTMLAGRKKLHLPVQRSNPPLGTTPAEAAYILKRGSPSTMVTALIFHLANAGHLTLSGTGKYLQMEMAVPLPQDTPPYLSGFYNTLFAGGKTILYEDALRTMTTATGVLQTQLPLHFKGKRQLQKPTTTFISFLVMLLAPVTAAFAIGYSAFGANPMVWLFSGLYCVFALAGAYNLRLTTRHYTGRGALSRTASGALCLGCSVAAAGMCYFATNYTVINFWAVIAFGAGGLAIALLAAATQKLTGYAGTLSAELQGLNQFMHEMTTVTAALHEAENPGYCYNLLPYAFLFGIEAKWAKLFDGIGISQPTFYTTQIHGFTLRSLVDNSASSFKETIKASARKARQEQRTAKHFGGILREVIEDEDGGIEEMAAQATVTPAIAIEGQTFTAEDGGDELTPEGEVAYADEGLEELPGYTAQDAANTTPPATGATYTYNDDVTTAGREGENPPEEAFAGAAGSQLIETPQPQPAAEASGSHGSADAKPGNATAAHEGQPAEEPDTFAQLGQEAAAGIADAATAVAQGTKKLFGNLLKKGAALAEEVKQMDAAQADAAGMPSPTGNSPEMGGAAVETAADSAGTENAEVAAEPTGEAPGSEPY